MRTRFEPVLNNLGRLETKEVRNETIGWELRLIGKKDVEGIK